MMLGVGAIEIVAGLLVAFKPRIGAYVVAAWLLGIIGNLLMIPGYYDVALRDFGLFLAALALARLSAEFDSYALRGVTAKRRKKNERLYNLARLDPETQESP
jgi:predicted tellurium resistance membrane protein TerC